MLTVSRPYSLSFLCRCSTYPFFDSRLLKLVNIKFEADVFVQSLGLRHQLKLVWNWRKKGIAVVGVLNFSHINLFTSRMDDGLVVDGHSTDDKDLVDGEEGVVWAICFEQIV